jgi:hypothetical protein
LCQGRKDDEEGGQEKQGLEEGAETCRTSKSYPPMRCTLSNSVTASALFLVKRSMGNFIHDLQSKRFRV